MKALNTYVLMLSQTFPVYHPKAGKCTYFRARMLDTLNDKPDNKPDPDYKRHTLRGNYELWRKRFDEIEAGEACLSIRVWSGKPYCSKQIEIARLTKEDGIGLELLCFAGNHNKKDRELHRPIVGGTTEIDYRLLAANDGLSLEDWEDWFTSGKYDLSEPMCIIHFTSFRYKHERNNH